MPHTMSLAVITRINITSPTSRMLEKWSRSTASLICSKGSIARRFSFPGKERAAIGTMTSRCDVNGYTNTVVLSCVGRKKEKSPNDRWGR